MRLLREPLVHFLALGGLLFALFALRAERVGGEPQRIVVTPGAIEHLASGFARTWQRSPTAQELEGLVDDYVHEEVYYREAMALGVDRDDVVVRRRLRQKMEFLVEDAAAATTPSDDELQAYLVAHPESFRVEPAFSFRQLYLSRDRRGDATARDAHDLVARLVAAGSDADIATLGDPLMVPGEIERLPESEVARLFGAGFVAAIAELEPGRWAGPVESGYGLHVVLIRARVDGRLPALAEVRAGVEREWLTARRKGMVEAAYGRLRDRYQVVVEPAVPAGDTVAAR